MKILRHPFITYSIRFFARMSYAGLWGVSLSQADLDTKLMFGVPLAVVASLLMMAVIASAPKLHRAPLYGLLFAGEALAVGAVVLAFLGAGTGQLATIPLCCCTFGGIVLVLYPTYQLYRDNMPKRRDLNGQK